MICIFLLHTFAASTGQGNNNNDRYNCCGAQANNILQSFFHVDEVTVTNMIPKAFDQRTFFIKASNRFCYYVEDQRIEA